MWPHTITHISLSYNLSTFQLLLSSPLPSLFSPPPPLVPRFGYLSEAPLLGGDSLHQCPQPPQCILHYPHSRCRQERIYCGSECVCVCYCCSLASFSFCCWGGACSSPIWFFMWFCISGTRVSHRCLFLEMFPELVHVWETIVWIHCTSQILNSFSNLFPLPSLFCSSFLPQGTSVVSPIITPVILISIMVLYATNSPARLLHTNCVVFFTAFYFPMSKMVIYMMVSESSLRLRIWLQ